MRDADSICPYSNAFRGNVPITLKPIVPSEPYVPVS
jgi:organic hydroperoxide reductase OsmC/OhrA